MSNSNTVQANADAVSAAEDTALTINVLSNDTGSSKTLYSVAQTGSAQVISATSALGAAIKIVNGAIVYDPAGSAAIQALSLGQTITDTFTYTIKSGSTYSTTTVTVTVHGTNDAPVLSADTGTHSFTEVAGVTGGSVIDSYSGSLSFFDSDSLDSHTSTAKVASVHTANVTLASTVWSCGGNSNAGGVPSAAAAALAAALTTSITQASGSGQGQVNFTFNLADKATDFLAAGETLTVTYNVSVSDNHGATATRPVVFTITGTNDAPTVTAASVDGDDDDGASCFSLLSLWGKSSGAAVSGSVHFTDPDYTDTHTVSASLLAAIPSSGVLASSVSSDLASAIKVKISADSTNGKTGTAGWSYTLPSSLKNLPVGQTVLVEYQITISDGHGGTTTQPVTLLITGASGGATVMAGVETGQVSELANTTGSTALDKAVGDIDLSGGEVNTLSSITSSVAFVSWSGGTGVPSSLSSALSSALALSLNADGGCDNHGYAYSSSANYTFSATDKTFDFLAQGETLTVVYKIVGTDRYHETATRLLTLTITGTNDTPVVAADTVASHALSEIANTVGSATADTATATLAFTDADLKDTHTATFAAPTIAWSGGPALPAGLATTLATALSLTLADSTNSGAGSVTAKFTAADKSFDFLAKGETLTVTYTVTVTDNNSATSTKPVTFTITGTNDTPVVAADTVAIHAITEAAATTGSATADAASATLSFTDVDLKDTHTASFAAPTIAWSGGATLPSGLATTLGTALALSVSDSTNSGAGSVTASFSAADKSFDFLAKGETLTVTYNVTVTDNNGATSMQAVKFVVTGTNDTPVIAADTVSSHAISEIANALGSTTADTASATLSFADADLKDTHTVSFAAPTIAWSAGGTLPSGLATTLGTALSLSLADSTNTGAGSVTANFSAADKNFDFLAKGETLTVTYNVTVTDNNGATSTQPVKFVVTGTNDGPIVAADAVASHALTEIASTTGSTTADTASATLAFTDVDLKDTHTASFAAPAIAWSGGATLPSGLATALGTALSLSVSDSTNSGAGSVTASFSSKDSNFDFLAKGETLTVTYNVTVTDNNGATSTQPVKFIVTGTNDAPVVAADIVASHAITEASGVTGSTAADTASATLAFTDVDLKDTHIVAFAAPAVTWSGGNTLPSGLAAMLSTALSLSLADSTNTGAGSVTASFSAKDCNFDFLAKGETLTVTYNVTVTDNNGVASTKPVTFAVTGTNDAPVLAADSSASHALTEISNTTGSTTADTASATLAFSDVDLKDTHTASFAAPAIAWSGGNALPSGLATALGTALSLSVSDSTNSGAGSVTASFSAKDCNFDFLAKGETLTVIYNVTVTDNNGAASTQPVKFLVTGTNDAPVVAADAVTSHAITEAVGTTGSTAADTASATLVFTDVDLKDTHTASFAAPAVAWSAGGTLPTGLAATLATALSLSLTDSTNSGAGSVAASFSAADKNFDFLAMGETLTVTYNVTIADNNGATSTKPVVFTVTGSNDGPVLAADTTASHALTELANVVGSTTADTASTTLSFTDVDLKDTHTTASTVASITWSGGATLPGGLAFGLGNALSLSLTDSTGTGAGSIAAAFATPDKAFDFLAAGETLTVIYNVTVTDNNGASSTKPVTFVVTGTNDVVSVAADTVATHAIGEAAGTTGSSTADTASATLTFRDADLNDIHTTSIAAPLVSLPGGGALPAGLAASLGSALSLSLADSTGTGAGSVTASFSAADKLFDFLAEGETLLVSYSITVADSNGSSQTRPVVFIVTGTNDGPVMAADAGVHALGEVAGLAGSSLAVTTFASLNFTDVDLKDTHTASIGAPAIVWSGGSALPAGLADSMTAAASLLLTDSTNSGAGSVKTTFLATDKTFDFLAQGETLAVTYNVTVADNNGASSTKPVTFTITGTNDAPVVSADTVASHALTETTGVTGSSAADTASATLSFADVDLNDTHSATSFVLYSATSWSGGPLLPIGLPSILDHALSLSVSDSTGNGAGSVTASFSVADNSFDFLAAGETLTVTYNVTVADNHGTQSTKPVVFTITGTNDAPVLAADSVSSHAISEVIGQTGATGSDNATAALNFTDIDQNDVHTASYAAPTVTWSGGTTLPAGLSTTLAGALSLSLSDFTGGGAGAVTANFAAADKTFDFLAQGETLTITYNVTVADNHGGTSTQPVTFTVKGTNDAPVLSASVAPVAVEAAATTGSNALDTVSTTMFFADVDLKDTHTASFAAPAITWIGNSGTLPAGLATALAGALSLNVSDSTGTGTGVVTATLSAADKVFDFLSANEQLEITYNVTVTDNNGAASTKPVKFTVAGTNDAPVLTADAVSSHAITEAANVTGSATADTASATLSFTDADLADSHTTSAVLSGVTWSGGAVLPSGLSATLASALTLTKADSTNTGAGTITASFAAADKSFDFLAQGETLTVNYNVTVADGHGGTATKPVSFTVTGTNDAPVFTAAPSTTAHTFTFSSGSDEQAAGTLGNNISWFQEAGFKFNGFQDYYFGLGNPGGAAISYTPFGTLANGAHAEIIKADGSEFALKSMDLSNYFGTENLAITAYDHGVLVATRNVTLTNSVGQPSAATNQTLTFDSSWGKVDDVRFTVTGGSGNQYILMDNVSVDAPIGSGPLTLIEAAGATGSATPDAVATVLNFADVDLSDTHTTIYGAPIVTWSGGANLPVGLIGALASALALTTADSTGSGAGAINASFAVADKNFDFLAQGETLTVTYPVTVTDNNGASATKQLTFTVTGTNDAPSFAAGTVNQAVDAAAHASAIVGFADVDLHDSHAVSFAAPSFALSTGGAMPAGLADSLAHALTLSLSDSTGSGAGSITADFQSDPAILSFLDLGDTLTVAYDVTVTDNNGATATKPVSFTVTGTNSAPIWGDESGSGLIGEMGGKTGSSDLDFGGKNLFFEDSALDTHTLSNTAPVIGWSGGALTADQVSAITAGLHFALTDSTGTGEGAVGVSLSAPDSTFDFLAQGETITVTTTVTVTDNHGVSASKPVTLTVTGTNDTPVFAGLVGGTDLSDGDQFVRTFDDNGMETDIGHGLAFAGFYANNGGVSSTGGPSLPSGVDGTLQKSDGSEFSLKGLSLSNVNFGSNGPEDITINGYDHGVLVATTTVHLDLPQSMYTFDYSTVTFDSSFSVVDDVEFNLNGGRVLYLNKADIGAAGDTTPPGGDVTSAALTEAAGTTGSSTADAASLVVHFADADLNDTHTASVDAPVIDYPYGLPDGLADLLANAVSLTVSDTIGAGSIKADFSIPDSAFDFLSEGETLKLTYNITVTENNGGTTTEPVTFTVTGTNDAPVFAPVATVAPTTLGFSDPGNTLIVPGSTVNQNGDAIPAFTYSGLTFTGFTADSHAPDAYGNDAPAAFTNVSQPLLDGGANGEIRKSDGSEFSVKSINIAGSVHLPGGTVTINGYDHGVLVASTGVGINIVPPGELFYYTVSFDNHWATVDDIQFTGIGGSPNLYIDDLVIGAGGGDTTSANLTEASGTMGSATAQTASFTLNFSDVDLQDAHYTTLSAPTATWSGGATLPDGLADTLANAMSLSLADSTYSGSGTVTASFSAPDSSFDFLAQGETLTVTYDVTVTDSSNASTTEPVTFTITGTNDAPVFASSTRTVDFSDPDGTLLVHSLIYNQNGQLVDSESYNGMSFNGFQAFTGFPDSSQGITAFIYNAPLDSGATAEFRNTDGSAFSLKSFDVSSDLSIFYGAGTLTVTGYSHGVLVATQDIPLPDTINFNHNFITVNFDSSWSTVDDVQFTDAGGAKFILDNLVIGAAGGGDHSAILTEASDTTGSTTPQTASVALNFTDVDLADSHTAAFAAPNVTWSGGTTLPDGLADTLANAMSLSLADSTHSGSGAVTASFSAPDSSFDFLAQGETLTVTYAVTVTDNHGATTTEPVSFTVTGSNDAPVISASAIQTIDFDNTADIQNYVGYNDAAGTHVSFTDNGFAFSGFDYAAPSSVTGSHGGLALTEAGAVVPLSMGAVAEIKKVDGTEFALKSLDVSGLAPSAYGSGGDLVITGYDHGQLVATQTVTDFSAGADPLFSFQTVALNSGFGTVDDVQFSFGTAGVQPFLLIDNVVVVDSQPGVAGAVHLTEAADTTAPVTASVTLSFTDVDLSDTHSVSFASFAEAPPIPPVAAPPADPSNPPPAADPAPAPADPAGPAAAPAADPAAAPAAEAPAADALAAEAPAAEAPAAEAPPAEAPPAEAPAAEAPPAEAPPAEPPSAEPPPANPPPANPPAGEPPAGNPPPSGNPPLTGTPATPSIVWSGGTTLPAGLANALAGALSLSLSDSTHTGAGSVTATFTTPGSTLDFLAQGETLVVTYTVTVTDNHGAASTRPVTITVTGTNSTPVIAADSVSSHAVSETANVTGSAFADTATATLSFSDADLTDTHAASFAAPTITWSGGTTLPAGLAATLASALSVSASEASHTVTANFSAADSAFDFLVQGETLIVTYDVTVTDSHGASSTKPVTFTVTGTNDAPVMEADSVSSHAFTETTGTGPHPAYSALASLGFADVDLADTHTASVAAPVIAWSGGGTLPDGLADTLANALTTTVIETAGSGTGVLKAAFSTGDGTFNFLAEGETLTVTYNVTVTDNNGASSTQPVSFTVTGTNDAPILAADTTKNGHPVSEAAGVTGSATTDTSGVTLSFSDADLSDTHTASFAAPGVTWSGGTTLPSGVATSLASALSVSISDASHTVSVNFSAADKSFDFLAQGETLTATYTVTVSDNHGGTSSQPVTFTVTGSNDAPVIAAPMAPHLFQFTSGGDTTTAGGVITGNVYWFQQNGFNFNGFQTQPGLGNPGGSAYAYEPYGKIPGVGSTGEIVRADGGEFSLKSLDVGEWFAAETVVITAYDHGVQVASRTVNLPMTGNPGYQSLTFDSLWSKVDDVRFNATSPGATYIFIDNVSVEAAAGTGPIALNETSNATGSASADTASTLVSFTDVDLNDTHTTSVAAPTVTWSGGTTLPSGLATALTGALTLTTADSTGSGAGAVTVSFSAADSKFDFLAQGETLTVTYTVTVTDNHGASSSQPVTVTITGTNDAPVLAAVAAAAVDAAGHAAVAVGFTDADLRDTHTASFAAPTVTGGSGVTVPNGLAASLAGALSLTTTDAAAGGSGSVQANFNAPNGAFSFLGTGQTVTVSYNVTVSDGHGGTSIQPVSFTVTGTNKAPVLAADSGSHAISELANTIGANTSDTASATLNFTDSDLSDTHTPSVAAPTVTWSGGASLPAGLATTLASAITLSKTDSTGSGAGTVTASFSAADKSFDFLAQGETLTVTYNVTVTDNQGASAAQPVTFTVTGTNDAPVLAADSVSSHAISEKTATLASAAADTATATLSFSDADLSDTHTASVAAPTITWSGGTTLPSSLATAMASAVSLNTSDASHTVTASFSAADSNFDFLAQGETLTITYNVTVSDNHGGSSVRPVTFTVTGTNDAPVLSAASANVIVEALATTGSTVVDTATVGMVFSDADLKDVHTVSFAAPTVAWAAGAGGTTPSAVAGLPAALASALSLSLSDSTGTGAGLVNATFSATDKIFDFLASGDTLTITYNVTVNDGHGGTSTRPVVFTVVGSNDAPVVTGTLSATVSTNGAASSVNAFANATDADANTTLSVVPPGSLPAGVTYNAASHSFTLDPTNAAYGSLGQGQSTTVTVNYGVTDGIATTADSVSWTLNGVNHAPTALTLSNNTVAENLPGIAIGTLVGVDPDSGSTLTYSINSGLDGALFAISGNNLAVGTSGLSAAQTPNPQVSVRVTDQYGAFKDVTLSLHVQAETQVALTTGTDNISGLTANTQVYGAFNTLNVTDHLQGAGDTALVLYGVGSGNLNNVGSFQGFGQVDLINYASGTTDLTLKAGQDMDVKTSGTGAISITGSTGHVTVESTSTGTATLTGGGGQMDATLAANGLTLTGGAGAMTVTNAAAGNGNLAITGGSGNLSYTQASGSSYDNQVTGGSGSGLTTIDFSHATTYFETLTTGTGQINYKSGVVNYGSTIRVNGDANWHAGNVIDFTADHNNNTNFYFYGSGGTIDLTQSTLKGITNLNLYTDTFKVGSADFSGAKTVNADYTLQTADAALDLTSLTGGNAVFASTNAIGTTFTVTSKAVGFNVVGGAGNDTLVANGVTYSAAERNAIFATTAIETIVDSSGTYTAVVNPAVTKLTSANDTVNLAISGQIVNGTATTLNAGDNLTGAGDTHLAIYGAGSFDLNSLSHYSGFSQVDLNDYFSNAIALTMKAGQDSAVVVNGTAATTITGSTGHTTVTDTNGASATLVGGGGQMDATLAANGLTLTGGAGAMTVTNAAAGNGNLAITGGSGNLSYTQASGSSYDNQVTGGSGSGLTTIDFSHATTYFETLTTGTGQINYKSGVVNYGSTIRVNGDANWHAGNVIDFTADHNNNTNFYFYGSGGTIDLTQSTLKGITNLNLYTDTFKVGSADFSGAKTVNADYTLQTADAALDLTSLTGGNAVFASTNAIGTTFTVTSKAVGFNVVGGAGNDTLVANGVTYSAAERDAIFATTAIETIVDSSGTYTAVVNPAVTKLTSANDTVNLAISGQIVNGTATTLNAGDNLTGAGDTHLAIYGAGSFDLNSLSHYSGFSQVDLNDYFSNAIALTMKAGQDSAVVVNGTAATTITGSTGHTTVTDTNGASATLVGGGGQMDATLAANGLTLTGGAGAMTVTNAAAGNGNLAITGGSGNLSYTQASGSSYDNQVTGGSGSGLTTIDFSHATTYFETLTTGTGQINYKSGVVNYGSTIRVNGDANWHAGNVIDFTADHNNNTNFYFYGSGGTIDLTQSTLKGITNLNLYTDTFKVGSADFSGAKTVNADHTLQTADAALDLTSLTGGSALFASTNATGTTFTVSNVTAAFMAVGGTGNDTLVANGFSLTSDQRAQVFTTTSIELVQDATGTYGNNAGQTLTARVTGDTVVGGSGIDTLISGIGNDKMTGGAGSDTFVFNTTHFGNDSVTDFTSGSDFLQFDHSIFADAATAFSHAAQVGSDVVITLDANDTVTLKGYSLANLHASDFHIV